MDDNIAFGWASNKAKVNNMIYRLTLLNYDFFEK